MENSPVVMNQDEALREGRLCYWTKWLASVPLLYHIIWVKGKSQVSIARNVEIAASVLSKLFINEK